MRLPAHLYERHWLAGFGEGGEVTSAEDFAEFAEAALGHTAARHTGTTAQAETVYVFHDAGRFVTPISTVTNMPGKRIRVAKGAMATAITPDGKTVYVANWRADTVRPITTATNRAGKPIRIAGGPGMIAIAI